MAINLPNELRDFSVDGTIGRPKGERLVARRLNRADSEHVRQVMGRGTVGVKTSKGVKQASVRPIGRMSSNAKVAIPMSHGVASRLFAALKGGKAAAVSVPAGVGSRLVRMKG